MHNDTESGESKKQNSKEEFSDFDTNNVIDLNAHKKHKFLEPHLQNFYSELRLRNLDIEEPKGPQPNQLIDAGVVEVWLQWQQEITRQKLAHWSLQVFTALIVLGLGIGFILFLITRKIEFLVGPPALTTTVGVLALLRKVFNYYFKHPKK